LVIAMLLGIATCAYLFAILWDLLPMYDFVQFLANANATWYIKIGVSALLLLLVTGFFLLMFVRTGTRSISLQEGIPITAQGDVRITVDAIKQMCEEVVRQDKRISLCDCSVHYSPQQGLVIGIKAEYKGEQNIAGIVESLQKSISDMILRSCGLSNVKVQVLVEKAEIVQPVTPSGFADRPQLQPKAGDSEDKVTGEGQDNG
jgi:hypothetical protein